MDLDDGVQHTIYYENLLLKGIQLLFTSSPQRIKCLKPKRLIEKEVQHCLTKPFNKETQIDMIYMICELNIL